MMMNTMLIELTKKMKLIKNNIKSKAISYSRNNDFELIQELKNFETNIVIINIHKRLTSKAINCINMDSTNLHYLLKERL